MSTTPYRERWRGPRPAFPNVILAVLVFLGCAALCAFTTGKLATMARLRGFTPGAPERVMTVERVRRTFNRSMAEYELVDEQRGTWGIQLTRAQIARIRYQTPVFVRCLEDERECFVPDSVYISDGNFGFDRLLRALELLGLLAAATRIAWRLRGWRSALRAWAQQAPDPAPRPLN
jgi:hypothetical protein